MTRELVRLALVMDHPTQQFAGLYALSLTGGRATGGYLLVGPGRSVCAGWPVNSEQHGRGWWCAPWMGVADHANFYDLLPADARAFPFLASHVKWSPWWRIRFRASVPITRPARCCPRSSRPGFSAQTRQ
jgi:hypothetical protein